MDELIRINITDIQPEAADVLNSQGIPADTTVPQKIVSLMDEAKALVQQLADPLAVMRDISIEDFESVFKGEGYNDSEAPLKDIYRQADELALYAVTLGGKVTSQIDDLFQTHDFALGMMLDSACSVAADNASHLMERYFYEKLERANGCSILGYSPGYCGWHVSAQKKLFAYLEPERIQLFLNSSYLMHPLKSVSGVLVAGNREIHDFDASFTFCKECKNRTCQDRNIDTIGERFAGDC